MYESPGPVGRDRLRERIFAPVAYSLVRSLRVVPIAHVEALALAAWFPVVWHASNGEMDLVAVRSLLTGGIGHPPGSVRARTSLPLVLRGYPFLLDPHQPDPSSLNLLYDSAVADQPTDAGAPITDAVGRLSRGTELKIKSLRLFARHLPTTREMSLHLIAEDLLAPWPLECIQGNAAAKLDNLQVLSPKAFENQRLRTFLQRFGSAGVNLIGGHRLSLFRAGVIVGSARKAMRPVARDTAPGVALP